MALTWGELDVVQLMGAHLTAEEIARLLGIGEETVKQRRPDLLERSPAVAILVGTSAGQMQLKRITRDQNVVLGVFSDEDESVSWLLGRIKESFK